MTQIKTYIQSYCTIQNNEISLNGETIFTSDSDLFSVFSKKVYQNLEINYPKFFKMDSLSKLAFLAAELLLKNEIDTNKENNIALVFSNKSSSLDTDMKYQDSISDLSNFYPSPAVFVYTLPNICIGEICIKHQLRSENSFFIFDTFNSAFMSNYVAVLLQKENIDKVLCGWVEYYKDEYKAFLYLVSKEGVLEHNDHKLETLFNN
jgi:hypothetical protein